MGGDATKWTTGCASPFFSMSAPSPSSFRVAQDLQDGGGRVDWVALAPTHGGLSHRAVPVPRRRGCSFLETAFSAPRRSSLRRLLGARLLGKIPTQRPSRRPRFGPTRSDTSHASPVTGCQSHLKETVAHDQVYLRHGRTGEGLGTPVSSEDETSAHLRLWTQWQ